MRLFILLLYYGFLRFLPATDNAYWIFSLFRKTRSWVGHFLFDQCGKQINIEHGANFGTTMYHTMSNSINFIDGF